MDTHGTDLTIDHMINNENIKADRFGMAAISYIFKAFGDDIRSKEYWPWSEKDNCRWPGLRGEYHSRDEYMMWAKRTLERASVNSYTVDDQTSNDEKNPIDISLIQLKERLKKSVDNVIDINDTNKNINKTSNEIHTKIDELNMILNNE